MVAGLEHITMPMEGCQADARGARRREEAGSSRAPRGRSPRRRPTAKAAASSALAALENMDITPEQRNYWAFKLPVQAPLPQVASPIW